MPIRETTQDRKGKYIGRPAVWPYTLFMLVVGTLVSIVFSLGAIWNYQENNWLVAGLLTFAATAFILAPPVITHKSLSPEADRMELRIREEDDAQNVGASS